MFFVLSKLLYFLLSPLSLAILLLTGAMAAMWRKRHALARRLGVAAWALLVVFGVLPVGPALVAWLETRVEAPAELPRRVDGIILLGGFMDARLGQHYGLPQVDGATDRLFRFVELAARYESARLVFTSGIGGVTQSGTPEGQMIKPLLEKMRAYTRWRLTIEDKSRTTYENAAFSKELAKPREGAVWLLVTSAAHMPRALGAFKSVGWDVTPVPTDYQTNGALTLLPGYHGFLGNMALSQAALKELGGTLLYALTGKWKTPDAS